MLGDGAGPTAARPRPPISGENGRQAQRRRSNPPIGADSDPPRPTDHPRPFSWSSSLLTILTILSAFVILCTVASSASTSFALVAAQPAYALYPPTFAAMLVGGVCALIYYLPTVIAVACFQILFNTDIRKGSSPPRQTQVPTRHRNSLIAEMIWSLMRDSSNTIKLALVVTPIYVLALGRSGNIPVESKSLEAAAGGQLAAAIMTLKIMMVGMREIWDLVPLVVFRWDRDARR